MGTYGDEVYTTFRGLNIPEYVMEYESFSHFYWYFSCIRKQYYLEVYLEDYF